MAVRVLVGRGVRVGLGVGVDVGVRLVVGEAVGAVGVGSPGVSEGEARAPDSVGALVRSPFKGTGKLT